MKQVTLINLKTPLKGIFAAIVSGLLLAFSICHPGIWQFSWAAFVPVLLACNGKNPRICALFWLITGLIYYGILLWWVKIFGYEPWVALTIFQTLYFALFGLVLGLFNRKKMGLWLFLLVPAAWAAMQWLRTFGMFGFTWGSLAHIQAASTFAVRPAVWGPWVLEFLVFQFNFMLVYLITNCSPIPFVRSLSKCGQEQVQHEREQRRVYLPVVICLLILGFFWCTAIPYGKDEPGGKEFTTAVLQGNEAQDVEVNDRYLRSVYDTYSTLSEGVDSTQPRLIVWPETTLPADITYLGYEGMLQNLAVRTGSCYLVGAYSPTRIPGEDRLRNSAYVIDSDGRTKGIYSKVRLVPFGEFVPWREQLKPILKSFPIRLRDVLPGIGRPVIDCSVGKIGTMICFESLFSDISRQEVADGANVLVIITNDGWFGRTQAAYQHLLFARLRAVETDRPIVRAAATGMSALISHKGEIEDSSGIYTSSVLRGMVRTRETRTPYVVLGDLFVYLFAGVSLVGVVLSLFLNRGLRGSGEISRK